MYLLDLKVFVVDEALYSAEVSSEEGSLER
jgi:hypothetical protein